jgi:TRAP-type C4-dicarboxylate transport system permease small subunit
MNAFIESVKLLSRVTGVVGAFLVGAAVLVICDMVVERYVFNLTTIWQIDVVTYCIVGATFVASPYVLMTRGHVNVDILPLHISPKARFWLALVTGIGGALLCFILFLLCSAYWYEAYNENWLSNTVWRARLWIPLLSMPVGLALLTLQYMVEILALLTGREPPFGIRERESAEDVARAQAEQALGGAG